MSNLLGDILGAEDLLSDDDDGESDFSFGEMGVPGLDELDGDLEFDDSVDTTPPTTTKPIGTSAPISTSTSSRNTFQQQPKKPTTTATMDSHQTESDSSDADIQIDGLDLDKYLNESASPSASESIASSISLGSLIGLGRAPVRSAIQTAPSTQSAPKQTPPVYGLRPSSQPSVVTAAASATIPVKDTKGPITAPQSQEKNQPGPNESDDDSSTFSASLSINLSSPSSSILPGASTKVAPVSQQMKPDLKPQHTPEPAAEMQASYKTSMNAANLPQIGSLEAKPNTQTQEKSNSKLAQAPSLPISHGKAVDELDFDIDEDMNDSFDGNPHLSGSEDNSPRSLRNLETPLSPTKEVSSSLQDISNIIAQQEMMDSIDNISRDTLENTTTVTITTPPSTSPTLSSKPLPEASLVDPENKTKGASTQQPNSTLTITAERSSGFNLAQAMQVSANQSQTQTLGIPTSLSKKLEPQPVAAPDTTPMGNIKDRISLWEKQNPITPNTSKIDTSSRRSSQQPSESGAYFQETDQSLKDDATFDLKPTERDYEKQNSRDNLVVADLARYVSSSNTAQHQPLSPKEQTVQASGGADQLQSEGLKTRSFESTLQHFERSTTPQGYSETKPITIQGNHANIPPRPPSASKQGQPVVEHTRPEVKNHGMTSRNTPSTKSQEMYKELSELRDQLERRSKTPTDRPMSARSPSPTPRQAETPQKSGYRNLTRSPNTISFSPTTSLSDLKRDQPKTPSTTQSKSLRRSSSTGSLTQNVRMTKSAELLIEAQKKKKLQEEKANKKRSKTPTHGRMDFQHSKPVEERLYDRKKTTESKIEALRKELEKEAQRDIKPFEMSQKSKILAQQRFNLDEKVKSKITYGDLLYEEGLMKLRNPPEPELPADDPELTFHPKISEYARSLDSNGFAAARRERLTRTKAKVVEAETQDLKFRPTINDYKFSTDYTKGDVVTRLLQKDQERKANIEKLRAETKPEEEVKSKPDISEYSKTLTLPENVFDRLYKYGKQYDELLCIQRKAIQSETISLADSTKPRSSSSTLEPKDPSRLYYEGLVRMQQQQELLQESESKEKELHSKIKLSERSAQLAQQKFEKEIRKAFDDCDTNHTGFMNRDQLEMSFRFLGLLAWREAPTADEQRLVYRLWAHLDPTGEGHITYDTYSRFMLVLHDLSIGSADQMDQEGEQENFLFTSRKLARELKSLATNRLAYTKIGKTKHDDNLDPAVFTFKPQINPLSKDIEENKPQDLERYEKLYRSHQENEAQLGLRKKAREIELQKECTFAPTINQSTSPKDTSVQKKETRDRYLELHELAKRKEKKPTTEELKAMEELELCTFQPNTLKRFAFWLIWTLYYAQKE
eukprot:TRINITY_DN8984_c0_g1_i1.p1 TRINITY_DN8984_c0_g1~~TRINITY_DN8984_c0_g1_i1.p1  ORF type:complete len:1358 (+),score=307.95 TRINITY_DN8984_c0_g1_i1:117-4190(+)